MNYERCPVCNIPMFDTDKPLWCKIRDCSKTQQRYPTEKHTKDLQLGEKDARKMG